MAKHANCRWLLKVILLAQHSITRGLVGPKIRAYKLRECFNTITLPVCLPTLVQFLHSITAVHKRNDEATLDTLMEQSKLCLSSPSSGKKKGWQLKVHVEYVIIFTSCSGWMLMAIALNLHSTFCSSRPALCSTL